MAAVHRDRAEVEQARYLAAELEQWIERLTLELDHHHHPPATIASKRRELYDVHRQLTALKGAFPQAFI